MFMGIMATGGAFAASAKLPFEDVNENDWFYSSVKYVFGNEIMKGTAGNVFAPEVTLSRAMAVALLHRVDGEPLANSVFTILFEDVPEGQWYTDAVKWAYENEIMVGRSNTVFAPTDDITRAEFAAIIYRYAEYAGLTLPAKKNASIPDEKDIPDFAKDAAKSLYEAEIIFGRSGNVFDPLAKITRAEAAAMIERFMKNAEEKGPDETDPPVTEPEVTEPEVTEPEVTEPEVTEPEVTEPEVTEPEVTEPEVTEPEVTEPEVTEPEVTEPEVTEPEVTEPEVTEPEVTEPEVTEPEVTEPDVTEPDETDPPITEPEELDPPVVDPGEDLKAYVESVYESVICVDHGDIDIVLGASDTITEENFLAIGKKILNLDWNKYTLKLVQMEKNPGDWRNVNREGGGEVYATYRLTDGTNTYQFEWKYWVLKYYAEKGNWYQGKDFATAIEVPCTEEVNPSLARAEAQAILDAIIANVMIPMGSEADEIYAALEAATSGLDTTFYEIEFFKPEAEVALQNGGEFAVGVHHICKNNYLVKGNVVIGSSESETDDDLLICFFGNSITLQGYLADHFEKFAPDKNIKTFDFSNNGWFLTDHLDWLKKWPDYAEMIAEEADIIVLQGIPSMINIGSTNASEIMDILGRDKEYYIFCGNTIIKGDEVVTVDGVEFESKNNTWFGMAKEQEKLGYSFIFTSDLAYYDPSLGLTTGDTKPDGLHPSAILGYSAALTLYCQIFGVEPTEQNNGVLDYADIPGDTKAEKDAFMVRLKNTVKDLIEFQNSEMGREVSNPDEPYPPATEPDETDPPVTEPDETDPPETEPDETDPPVTEPDETDPPITEPDDGYIDIYLFGNSITLQGNIEDHLKKFTNGENIRVYDHSNNGWYLENQVEFFKKWPEYAAQIANEADIIIMQEYGGVYPHVGDNKELADISDKTTGMPAGFCRGDNVVGELMDILGRDKKYYSYTSSLSYGLMKSDEYIDFDGSIRESQNEALLRVREIFKEQYNFTHLYVSDLAAFEPEFGFTGRDYTFPDYTHPSPIMGYTAALLLYCEIFGVDPTEQGNGALTASDIPAGIEDFDGFMAMVKNAVKEMIELHHLSEDVDPPVTEPDETDPPATEPENVINICLFNSEGVNPFGIVRNLEALQEDSTIKVHDYSKMGWSLSDYIEWLSENPDVAEWIREEGDIILLEEFMSEFPTVGDDADIAAIADNIDTISHDFYKGENVVGQFIEMLGEDKEYYSYSSSMCGGVMKYDEYIGPDGELTESQNAALLNIRKILKEKYNITHIFASDIAAFEPALGLSSYGGTFIDNLHALPITGYCTALTVYCEIFGKSAVEQNNGILTDAFINPENGEGKSEFMHNVKKVVDEIVAVQNGEVLPLTSSEVNP